MVFEVGLRLGEKKYVHQDIEPGMCRDTGEEEREIMDLPNGNQDFILRRFGECAWLVIGRYITRFNSFEINPAHIHLAGIDAEQRVITPIPAGGHRSLRPAPVRLLRQGTRDNDMFRLPPRLSIYGCLVLLCG